MSDALLTRAVQHVLGDDAPDQAIAATEFVGHGVIKSVITVTGESVPLTTDEGLRVNARWRELQAEADAATADKGQPIAAVGAALAGPIERPPDDIAVMRLEHHLGASGSTVVIEVSYPAFDGRRDGLEAAMRAALDGLIRHFGAPAPGGA